MPKHSSRFIAMLLITLACRGSELGRTLIFITPTPTETMRPTPTEKTTFTPKPPTLTAAPIPDWVADFSDPILKALTNRQPDFHDEFSRFNRGWFRVVSGERARHYYALIQNGALLLELPEGKEDRNLTVYNPKLDPRDFVLSFDFNFGKTEHDDELRVQFNQTPDQNVALDLSKNESSTFHWYLQSNRQSSTGTYFYFSPERINVVIIMRGRECALYLNHDPLDYFRECRSIPATRPFPSAVTFQLRAEAGCVATATIDNVQWWDLDKLPAP